jgi:hypothetical protein
VKRLSLPLLARIGAGVLLLIVMRALGEVFRLEYAVGEALTLEQVRPFIVGALGAAAALAVALLAILAERPRLALAVAIGAIVLLFIYKVLWIG